MKQSLSLSFSTIPIHRIAIIFYCHPMSFYSSPSFDLSIIFIIYSSSHIISTISLKPSSGIVRINSSFFFPIFQIHRSIYSKKIKLGILFIKRYFCIFKPFSRKFIFAVCHIFTSKYSSFKHFLWS